MAGFRTIVINKRCKLESRLGYLVIRNEDEVRIHLSEIENLIIESTAVALTTFLIIDLVKADINVIFCDSFHMPYCQLSALSLYHNSTKIIYKQINWTKERKKSCWQLIIKEKINQQAVFLKFLNHLEEYDKLISYRENVLKGDQDNQEAKAAKCYFTTLFGYDFKRSSENCINASLNYGYSLLISSFAREIVACGYITQLGVWHSNSENTYNLASDLMEPFRPLVDRHVYNMPVDAEDDFKHYMINLFSKKIHINDEDQSLVYAIRLYVYKFFKFMNFESEDMYELKYEI